MTHLVSVADPGFALWGGSSPFFFLQPPFLLLSSFLSPSSPSFLPILSLEFLRVGGLEPPAPTLDPPLGAVRAGSSHIIVRGRVGKWHAKYTAQRSRVQPLSFFILFIFRFFKNIYRNFFCRSGLLSPVQLAVRAYIPPDELAIGVL